MNLSLAWPGLRGGGSLRFRLQLLADATYELLKGLHPQQVAVLVGARLLIPVGDVGDGGTLQTEGGAGLGRGRKVRVRLGLKWWWWW